MPERVLALDWIDLSKAAICLNGDCEAVFPLAALRCPKCTSSACMPLITWLQSAKVGK